MKPLRPQLTLSKVSNFNFPIVFSGSMGCSTTGLPVPHHFPEFAQVHVHCIRDAVQASHPLMPYSPSTHNLSQYQGLFQQVMFALDDQITGASVLLVNAQGWCAIKLTGLISLLFKGLSGVFQHHHSKASIRWCSACLKVQLSQLYMTPGKTIAWTIQILSAE